MKSKWKKWLAGSLIITLLLPALACFALQNNAEDVRKDLKQIIGQDRYSYMMDVTSGNASHSPSLMDRIKNFIIDLWSYLYKTFRVTSVLTLIIYLLFIALIIFLFYRLIKGIDFSFMGKKDSDDNNGGSFINLDFEKEINHARLLMEEGLFRESISAAVNALWLFLHYHRSIHYIQGVTNREYLTYLSGNERFRKVNHIVKTAEEAVYADSSTNKNKCIRIIDEVTGYISQP